jgi:rhodanese-related sulfurtransferase
MEKEEGFYTAEKIHNLSPREAFNACNNGALLLDVREEYINQYKKIDVPLAIQIPLSQLESKLENLPRDKKIIVVDSAGLRSKESCLLMKGKGFTLIENLAGGIIEWEHDGMPLLFNDAEKLSGSCMCQLKPRG